MRKHTAKKRNGWQTLVIVRSCFIGCVQRIPKDWRIRKYTQPLAQRKQQVEPRHLLLPTGKIERLCISIHLSSNDQLMLRCQEIFTCVCRFYGAIKCDKMSKANNCFMLPIVITQMIASVVPHHG